MWPAPSSRASRLHPRRDPGNLTSTWRIGRRGQINPKRGDLTVLANATGSCDAYSEYVNEQRGRGH